MPGFAKIAAPVYKMLKKGELNKFVLDEQARQAVEKLKNRLINPAVLVILRLKRHYTVNTDASDTQVGCVLLREREVKVLNIIDLWYRSLCDAESRYDTTRNECLAVVWSALLLRPFLEGLHFVIRTDHQEQVDF